MLVWTRNDIRRTDGKQEVAIELHVGVRDNESEV